MIIKRLCLPAAMVVLSSAASSAAAAQSPVLDAMKTELARSMSALRSSPTPPYFIGYDITELRQLIVRSSFGAITQSSDDRRRALDVQVRVGSYAFDNTHATRTQFPDFSTMFDEPVDIPVDDDPMAIRGALWYETEQRFRAAVEQLSRANTNARLRVAPEDSSPDFSHEPAEHYSEAPQVLTIDRRAWEERLRRITAPFARQSDIYGADAVLTATVETHWYVNSEGTELQTSQPQYRLIIAAFSKAADGMELPRYESFFASSPEGLPDEATIVQAVDRMIVDLHALQRAPTIDPYTGPAILSGRASAVFFHEILGHRLEGHRQRNEDEAQTFTSHVRSAVLPAGFSVYFDPTLQKVGNTELAGYYRYDDEGVRARRVDVIDHGVLKTFLMSRMPIQGFASSNGHGRRQIGLTPVARQSNLIVDVAAPRTRAQLKQQLLAEIRRQKKPFGLFFDDIEGGFTMTQRGIPNAFEVVPVMVYRVFPDGHEELVRGVDLIGTPLTVFSKVTAGDDQVAVFNGMCGAESGFVPVSAVSPGVLISQIEVQKKPKSSQRPPILPPPPEQTAAGSDTGSVVLRAMRDELARSMAELHLDTMPKPYFLSYRIDEVTRLDAAATRGSLINSDAGRDRRLVVELRVGDYTFDNTNFLSMPTDMADFMDDERWDMPDVPLDDDYAAIRRQLWLATDKSYKTAIGNLARKRAALASRTGQADLPDFTREDPVKLADEQPNPRLDQAAVEAVVRAVSAAFRQAPEIYRSRVTWSGGTAHSWYVNSEGTTVTRAQPWGIVRVVASTRASDGTPLSDGFSIPTPTPDALPGQDTLTQRVADFSARLVRLRSAPLAETYAGPVLIEGRAAAELFAANIGSQLGAGRVPLFDNVAFENFAMTGSGGGGLMEQLGARILPRSFTVTENPTQRTYEGRFIGGALVDDEGVRTRETRLVEKGMLRTLLTTRVPVQGISRSTGSRRTFGAAPTNVFVSTDSGLTDAQLRSRALALARERGNPFVIVVRRLGSQGAGGAREFLSAMGGGRDRVTAVSDAVKLYPDGHEEPVRGTLLTGISTASFKDIVAASRSRVVVTLSPRGPLGGGFAMVMMFAGGMGRGMVGGGSWSTYVVPSLLFDDVSIRKQPSQGVAPPTSSPPWVAPQ